MGNGLLMRGPRPLDRERNSSHVLIVEAYNHDLGPMRSSVRVRWGGRGREGLARSQSAGREALPPLQQWPQSWAKTTAGPEMATS